MQAVSTSTGDEGWPCWPAPRHQVHRFCSAAPGLPDNNTRTQALAFKSCQKARWISDGDVMTGWSVQGGGSCTPHAHQAS